MLVAFIKIILGFIVLTWSANHLVNGASALARNIGVPPLLIGLTIIAIGTSAPEIIVSIIASLEGSPGIAIGNAVGSNIANIGLVIGFCALIRPLAIEKVTFQLELPILTITSILVCLLLWVIGLNLVSGILLLLVGLLYVLWLIRRGQNHRKADKLLSKEYAEVIPSTVSTKMATFWLVIGLVLLPISANILVEGAVLLARGFGISEVIIGLTIIAIGTSLPELAASTMGTLKGEDSIAIGNIIGSNIFNLTAVLCVPGFLATNIPIDPNVFKRDLPIMLLFTLIFVIVSRKNNQPSKISRFSGALLLILYLGYIGLLGMQTFH